MSEAKRPSPAGPPSGPITTAFLGVAHIHTPDFIRRLMARADEVRVEAVYDHDVERGRRRVAELPGARFVADPAAVLEDPGVASVVVCAETNRHLELVVAAARAGKHIFCEKPLGLGASDARVMAEAVKAAGVSFQTGFFQRGHPVNRFVAREVGAGHLGRITRVRYSNAHEAALAGWFDTDWRWLTDPRLSGGGAMLDLGAHPLDLVLQTYGPTEGEVTGVSASLGNRVGRYGPEVDEYGTALLTFASGATAVIEASWVDPQLRSPLEVFGTEGQIQAHFQGTGDRVLYRSSRVEGADGQTPITDLPPAAPHAFELFWDALLGRELAIPLVGVDEAAAGNALMEHIYRAAGRRTAGGPA